MKERSASRSPSHAGFTLVEIMVVVVILGLLATLVTRNVLGSADEARITKAKTDIEAIAGAVDMYYLRNSYLPENGIQDLLRKDDKGHAYLNRYSKDPWGNDYEIVQGEHRHEFTVVSAGPDRTMDTDDDISNATKAEDQ